MIFYIVISFVIIQRLIELMIAKSNENWLLQQGAKIYGESHYKFMVLLHVGFFVFLIAEVLIKDAEPIGYWQVLLMFFILLQVGRVWVIKTLGRFWNTKIIVLKDVDVVFEGPFKYVKHPNYLIVTLELLLIPLMFQAYITLIVIFILNQIILAIRIPIEESALKGNTNYSERFKT